MASATSFRSIIGMQPSTASTNDSTLVIIDAQNEYAEGKLKVKNVDQSRKAIADLLERYRNASGGSIVHVTHQTPVEGAPVFTSGTKLANEFDELAPKSGEAVIVKNYPGSFTGTDLQKELEKSGKKKVVLTGYMAHVCVSTTARQAAEKGYDVIIPEDAVGDRDIPGVGGEELTRIALSEISDAFGSVVKSSDIK